MEFSLGAFLGVVIACLCASGPLKQQQRQIRAYRRALQNIFDGHPGLQTPEEQCRYDAEIAKAALNDEA